MPLSLLENHPLPPCSVIEPASRILSRRQKARIKFQNLLFFQSKSNSVQAASWHHRYKLFVVGCDLLLILFFLKKVAKVKYWSQKLSLQTRSNSPKSYFRQDKLFPNSSWERITSISRIIKSFVLQKSCKSVGKNW